MDAIIMGVGQAAKVLLLVELGQEVVRRARNDHQPSREILVVSPTVKAAAHTLLPVLNELETVSATALRNNAIRYETDGFYQKARECARITGYLARVAEEEDRSDGIDIDTIETELTKLRHDLLFNLLTFIEAYAQLPLAKQNAFIAQLDAFTDPDGSRERERDSSGWLDGEGFGFKLIECLAPIEAPGDSLQQLYELQTDMIDALYQNAKVHDADTASPITRSARTFHLTKRFLGIPNYKEPKGNEMEVSAVYKAAFNPIFEDLGSEARPWANFCQWLGSSQQLYWITGEHQSGKSTLMSFITHRSNGVAGNQAQCTPFLCKGESERPLVIATFYFNAPGTPLSSSKEAMFQSLLYQIMIKCSETVSIVSPTNWKALCLFDDAWIAFKEQDLQDLLLKTLTALDNSRMICLFIDGLDELDNANGDLARLFKNIIDDTSTKMCIVSRSSLVYGEVFGCEPHLEMRHLTRKYLTEHVIEMLEASDDFRTTRLQEPGFTNQLVDDIVAKAAGVFLWARIVTNLVIDGLRNGENISLLLKYLDRLPPGIEDLYQHILSHLVQPGLSVAARFFLLLDASAEPPPAMLLSYAMEDNPKYAIKLPTEVLPKQNVETCIEALCGRVMMHCKGLIEFDNGKRTSEASWLDGPVARYLDKSVKNFINLPHIQNLLRTAAGSGFDPHLRLCAAYLALHKVCEPNTKQLLSHVKSTLTFADRALLLCMRHACGVEPRHNSDMIDLLDQVEIGTKPSRQPWWQVESCIPQFLCQMEGLSEFTVGGEVCGPSFLSLAVKCGVSEYVKARMPARGLVPLGDFYPPNHPKDPLPLLLDAVKNSFPDARMVSVLLQGGADPNGPVGTVATFSRTIWGALLSQILCVFANTPVDMRRREQYTEIVRLMVQYGASIDAASLEKAVEREYLRVRMFESHMKVLAGVLKRDFEKIKTDPNNELDLSTIVCRARKEAQNIA